MTHQSNNTELKSFEHEPSVSEFFFKDFWGFHTTPSIAVGDAQIYEDLERRFCKALCYAIGSGGVYTDAQVRWLKGYVMTKNIPQSVVDSIDGMLKEGAELMDMELISESSGILNDLKVLRDAGPIMIYDMHRCARIEQYPDPQMVAIALLAEELGVNSAGYLDQIKEQVELEEEVKQKRIRLLAKDHVLLDKQYKDL